MATVTALLPPGPLGELNVPEQGEDAGTAEYKGLHGYAFNGGIFLLYQAKSFHQIKSWDKGKQKNQWLGKSAKEVCLKSRWN